jgi:hypothetical protein
LTIRAAAAALGRGAVRLAVSAGQLARRYPLETAAVTLLALGGLVLPFPYWLFGGLLGGVLSIWSSMWLARDKWLAVVGPLVVVIVGTILDAVKVCRRWRRMPGWRAILRAGSGSWDR